MIPVRQTRHAIETLGNCFEACIASILEVPLSSVPDRSDFVDADAWADRIQTVRREKGEKAIADLIVPAEFGEWESTLVSWLAERGLAKLELDLTSRRNRAGAVDALAVSGGYWIGVHYIAGGECSHAVVHRGEGVAWNPETEFEIELGDLRVAHVLMAADPPLIARRLGPELLPDVEGALREAGLERVWVPDDRSGEVRSHGGSLSGGVIEEKIIPFMSWPAR